METVKEHLQIRDKKEFLNAIEKTKERIEKYVQKNDYRVSNPIEVDKKKITDALDNTSLKKRKVMRRYMYKIEHHPTLDVINKFLHFLYKTLLKSDYRSKVLKSVKEESIDAKRKEFKAALQVMLEKKAAYQLEKGDFYKRKLQNA